MPRHAGDREQRPLGILERRTLRADRRPRPISDLLSNGSSLTVTLLVTNNTHTARVATPTAIRNRQADPARAHDRAGQAAIKSAENTLAVRSFVLVQRVPFRMQAQHQPRRDHHGDEEREQHRRRRVGRDRRHVGPHQAGDEQHRQQRRHHGQGGDDGRIADFRHRLDRALHSASGRPSSPSVGRCSRPPRWRRRPGCRWRR